VSITFVHYFHLVITHMYHLTTINLNHA
jgi:hypothetical protein